MSERYLKGLSLVLEFLDFKYLKILWYTSLRLRSFYDGVKISIEDRDQPYLKLTIPSPTFFSKILQIMPIVRQHYLYVSGRNIAAALMEFGYIEESAYVVRQLCIENRLKLAQIALIDGSLKALDALPHSEEIMQLLVEQNWPINHLDAFFVTCFQSAELYRKCNFWQQVTERIRCRGCDECEGLPFEERHIVPPVESVVDRLMVAAHRRSYVSMDYFFEGFNALSEDYKTELLERARKNPTWRHREFKDFAQSWGYSPALQLASLFCGHDE